MSIVRLVPSVLASAVLALATVSCGTSNSSGTVPTNPPGSVCSIGTQVSLSSPTPNQTGVPTNIGHVQIVVNASTDILGNSWNLYVVDQFGNKLQGGTLTLTSNSGGYHPFPNDYYYNSTIPQLQAGIAYNVYLNQFTSACSPLFVNTFFT